MILFTTPRKIKENSAIQDNVDDTLIVPYIQKSQFTHIHQLLGTDLYEKIILDIESGTLSGNYRDLLIKYITPCLIEWTVYEVMPFIALQLNNKSITKGKSEFSDAGDLNDLKYLRSIVRNQALFHNKRLMEYLMDKSSLFPEYLLNSSIDKIKPSRSTSLIGGIYIGSSKNNNFGMDF